MRLSDVASRRWIVVALARAAAIVGVLYGIMWIIGLWLRPYQELRRSLECRRNVHMLVRGWSLYADDYDGRYMPAERWEPAIDPYVPDRYRRCPSVPDGAQGSGYGACRTASGAERAKLDDEETTPVVMDSARIGRNVVGDLQDVPVPGRHVARSGQGRAMTRGNWVGYASGRCALQPDGPKGK
jgi:hypothetical protein